MSYELSTGLRNYMMATGSFKAALADGFIRILSGPMPATADAAETGTLLAIISDNGTGAGLDLAAAAASGSINKEPSQVWKGTVLSPGGTAGYFRYVENTGTAGASTTEKRLQGEIGTSGKDLNLTSVNLVTGADQTIDAASFTLPTF